MEVTERSSEEKVLNTSAQDERILVSKRAFEALIASFSTPDKPSDKLLAAVAAYHEHSPIKRRI